LHLVGKHRFSTNGKNFIENGVFLREKIVEKMSKNMRLKIYYNENLKSPDFEICIKKLPMGPSLVLKNRIKNGHCYRDIEKIQKRQGLLSAPDIISSSVVLPNLVLTTIFALFHT
jgi:hypothetical protein